MNDDKINPEEWTTKELVKHLYRELKGVKDEMHSMNKSIKILENDKITRDAKAGLIGAIGGAIVSFIVFLVKTFS